MTTLPYVRESQTSKLAAESMEVFAGSLREQVYQHIKNTPQGLTCDEIEVLMAGRHQTISARVRELKVARRIIQDGRRKTRSGRSADIHFDREDTNG